jgi:hypothetical protein
MSYSIEPAYKVGDELIRLIIKAGTDPVNQWFFSDGAFPAADMVERLPNTWFHDDFVVIAGKEIIALFSATWDRPLQIVTGFRLLFFNKLKQYTATKAFFQYLDYLFVARGCCVFNWTVAIKNQHAMRQYDRFIEKICGHLIGIKTRGQMGYTGEISDIKLYEITKEEYFNWKLKTDENKRNTLVEDKNP